LEPNISLNSASAKKIAVGPQGRPAAKSQDWKTAPPWRGASNRNSVATKRQPDQNTDVTKEYEHFLIRRKNPRRAGGTGGDLKSPTLGKLPQASHQRVPQFRDSGTTLALKKPRRS
jgi:hypothetical protein